MRKTVDLLNEIVAMGFDREEALQGIDASLDRLIERQPLMEEEITEELYNDIKAGFIEELEAKQGII